MSGKTVELICHCGCKYTARVADINRGWGMSCSKSCAAVKREFGRPNPRYAESGKPVGIKKHIIEERKDKSILKMRFGSDFNNQA